MRAMLMFTLPFLMITVSSAKEPPADVGPIVSLTKASPKAKVFEDATRQKPVVIKTEEDAGKYFEEAEWKKIKADVDLQHQFLLIFAWKGSGQDQMTFDIAESSPEQIMFHYKPGRTRDLRPHVKIYALRSNVKWSVKK